MVVLTSVSQLSSDVENIRWTINIFADFVIASIVGSGIAVGVQGWLNHRKEKKIMNSVHAVNNQVKSLDNALTVLSKCIATSVAGREYPQGIPLLWKDSAEAYRIIKNHLDKDSDYLKMIKAQTASDFLQEYGISYENKCVVMGYIGEYHMVVDINFSQLKDELLLKDQGIESKLKTYNDMKKFKYFWKNE